MHVVLCACLDLVRIFSCTALALRARVALWRPAPPPHVFVLFVVPDVWKAFATGAGFDKRQSQAAMQFAAFVKAEYEEAGPQVPVTPLPESWLLILCRHYGVYICVCSAVLQMIHDLV